MFQLPSPLHSAVIHFPIVLLLIGAAVAAVSVFVNRWHLTWFSALLLVLGAVGAFVAVETGEDAREIVGELVGATKQLVDSHQEWAERTEIVAGITAVFAILAAVLGEFSTRLNARKAGSFVNEPSSSTIIGFISRPTVANVARATTAAAALLSCFFVYQTARRGGEMVYDHGVGVNVASGQLVSPSRNHNKN